jgi:hypothetical protein
MHRIVTSTLHSYLSSRRATTTLIPGYLVRQLNR